MSREDPELEGMAVAKVVAREIGKPRGDVQDVLHVYDAYLIA